MGWLGDRLYGLGRTVVWGLDSLYGKASIHGDQPFFDADEFPWIKGVEADWKKVRVELDEILRFRDDLPNFQDISKEQRELTQDDGWKTFFFYAYGVEAEGNCRRCPETVKVLNKIPGMKTAFFSILVPGKRLPPHRGPYKGVLRLHLALLVPEPREASGIRVADETRHWEEGKVMVFDDTFDHEAWNGTDGTRVVLFVDLVRPMRFPVNVLNNVMIRLIAASPFVAGSHGNYLKWEERFEKIVNSKPAA